MYAHHYDSALKEAKNAQKLLPKNRSAWNLMLYGRRRNPETHRSHRQVDRDAYEALRIGKSVRKNLHHAIINSLAAALYFYGRRGKR
jgi:3'-phosphoadenosine 5'-phosphosulfate sulfotransferase